MKIAGIYRKILSKLSVFSMAVFFTFFYFAIYKMVDSEYSIVTYKSVKISIGAVTRNS